MREGDSMPGWLRDLLTLEFDRHNSLWPIIANHATAQYHWRAAESIETALAKDMELRQRFGKGSNQ